MKFERLQFSTVKESRDWYFVEYSPPQAGDWYATLNVQVHRPATNAAVAEAMEAELGIWTRRYPMPVFVSAWDQEGDLHSLNGTRECAHLTGWLNADTGAVETFWRMMRNDEAPRAAPSNEELLRIYADIPHACTSQAARDREFRALARRVRTGKWLATAWLIVWLAFIPAGVAILEWAAPWWWLGALVLAYSLYKAFKQALKAIGRWRPGRRESEAQDKQRRMERFSVECERNPEGFERLKLENLEREAREQIQKEARELSEG
jgi:hypothetical protein